MSFALLADDEKGVRLELCAESGVELTKMQVVNIKRAWLWAREQVPNPEKGGSASSSAAEASMPAGAEEHLSKAWMKHHDFNFHGARLVDKKLFTKIYIGLMKSPQQLFYTGIENIRLQSNLNLQETPGTFVTSAGIVPLNVPLPSCSSHPEAWWKLRAYFTTIAYIMDEKKDWYSFETNEVFVDSLYVYINMRSDGKRPGLEGIKNAFTNMMSDFALEIQNHSATLEQLVKNKSGWTHHWKDSELTADSGDNKRQRAENGASPAAKPLTEEVIRMVHNNAGLLKSLQSQIARTANGSKDIVGATDAPGAAAAPKDPKKDNNKGGGKRARNGRQPNRWVSNAGKKQ